jgi:hypothetical protein
VRVVVNGQPLGGARRVVGVGLGGLSKPGLQLSAEEREREVVQVQRLEDDRRARRKLPRYPFDVGGACEGPRSPRQLGRVVARVELRVGLDEAEGRKAKRARADETLDVRLGEQVVVPSRFASGDVERLVLEVAR